MTDTQLTLTGDEMDVDERECEKYGIHCKAPAEYAVDVFAQEIGEEITVICCQSCRDECAEHVESDQIRGLSRSERLVPREGER